MDRSLASSRTQLNAERGRDCGRSTDSAKDGQPGNKLRGVKESRSVFRSGGERVFGRLGAATGRRKLARLDEVGLRGRRANRVPEESAGVAGVLRV